LRVSIYISGAIVAVAAMTSPGLAGSLTQCEAGQPVEDDGGRRGQIVGERDTLCLVRSDDGRLQSWIRAERLSPAAPVAAEPTATSQPAAGEDSTQSGPPTLLKPKRTK
jgi:hypothetical protein